MFKREKVIKTRTNWKKEGQVKKIKTIMTAVAVILCISIAAGAVLAWIEIKQPFHKTESPSAAPSSSTPEEELLPVYENTYNLVLVSAAKELPEGFEIKVKDWNTIQVDEKIFPYLEKLMEAAKKDGMELVPESGYISKEKQNELFQQRVEALMAEKGMTRVRAEEQVQSIFGRGGYSENQTGMAVSFSSGGESVSFDSTKEFQWMQKNAVQYGFVLRYPENKANRTGMAYDPSHYRFVGVENAMKMRQYAMCLEEYVSYLKAQGAF